MKKIIFVLGLLLGWLASALIPPPDWLMDQVQSLFQSGKQRVAVEIKEGADALSNKINDRQQEASDSARRHIEEGAASIERKIEKN